MNMDSVNKWLTLAANIGVIAGIVFLAFEVRQNSEALHSDSRQDLLNADLEILGFNIDYPELLIMGNAENISPTEAARLSAYYVSLMRSREYAWHQYRNGILDDLTWDSYMRPLAGLFDNKRGRDFIRNASYEGDPEFKIYLLENLVFDN